MSFKMTCMIELNLLSFTLVLKCDRKINQVSFSLTTWEHSVNRRDLRAPTLAYHPDYTKDQDPLAVQHLNNLTIYYKVCAHS